MFSRAWYWKRFYWKIFTVVVITGGGAMASGLSLANENVISTIAAEKILFWYGVVAATVKGVDALVDQTFSSLSNGNGNGKTNGNGTTPPPTDPH